MFLDSDDLGGVKDLWVLKLNSEVWKTLYATPPNGEIFAMTIQQILIREHNWVSHLLFSS